MHSLIFYDEESWVLHSTVEPFAIYTMVNIHHDLVPIGRQIWKVTDGGNVSASSSPAAAAAGSSSRTVVELTLSVCSGEMFTCDSGNCIDIE